MSPARTWGMLCFSVLSSRLPCFKLASPPLKWKDLQHFLQSWADSSGWNLKLLVFYQIGEFSGRQTGVQDAFLRQIWPHRCMWQTWPCSSHLLKQGITLYNRQSTLKKILLDVSIEHKTFFFLHPWPPVLFSPHQKYALALSTEDPVRIWPFLVRKSAWATSPVWQTSHPLNLAANLNHIWNKRTLWNNSVPSGFI